MAIIGLILNSKLTLVNALYIEFDIEMLNEYFVFQRFYRKAMFIISRIGILNFQ
jgi:hypothetical protein